MFLNFFKSLVFFLYLYDENSSLIVLFSLGKSTIWNFYKLVNVIYRNNFNNNTNLSLELNKFNEAKMEKDDGDKTSEYDKTAVTYMSCIMTPLASYWAYYLLSRYKYKRYYLTT